MKYSIDKDAMVSDNLKRVTITTTFETDQIDALRKFLKHHLPENVVKELADQRSLQTRKTKFAEKTPAGVILTGVTIELPEQE